MFLFLIDFFFPQLATSEEEIESAQALVIALLQIGVGLLEIVVYLATLIVFLMWLYRSYQNLRAFGGRNQLKYSPGWAVGSFFVPFVSLVVPYRAMKELWSRSVPNSGDFFGDQSPPGFFPLWWAVWLVSNFANQIYFRISWQTELSSEVSSLVGLLTAFLDLLAAILALMVVREIDRQQMASEKLIGTVAHPGPPPPPMYGQPDRRDPQVAGA